MLSDTQTPVPAYREAFYRLGNLLAERIPEKQLGKSMMLVCTSEDADFLARGILDSIANRKNRTAAGIAFACFWHARFTAIEGIGDSPAFDVAPIVKKYEETSDSIIDTLIIAKSIISSSCVIRHALLDVVGRKQPKRIFIVAPVILQGAQQRLNNEFPEEIRRRFQFIFLAEDDQKDNLGNVSPGIGGSVYERLGITEHGAGFVPRIVTERRAAHIQRQSVQLTVASKEN